MNWRELPSESNVPRGTRRGSGVWVAYPWRAIRDPLLGWFNVYLCGEFKARVYSLADATLVATGRYVPPPPAPEPDRRPRKMRKFNGDIVEIRYAD